MVDIHRCVAFDVLDTYTIDLRRHEERSQHFKLGPLLSFLNRCFDVARCSRQVIIIEAANKVENQISSRVSFTFRIV